MISRLIFVGLLGLAVTACQTSALHINATYERLYGVAVEDRVLFEQNVAGSVAAIAYTAEGTYTLKLKIAKGFSNAVTDDSQFHIIDDPSREGHKAVDIRLAQPGGNILADGTTIKGVAPPEALADRLQKDLEAGFDFIQSQIDRFSQDIQKIPNSDAYRELKQSMEAVADEILRAEKEARDRLKEKWVPKLERQLDALREKLRQLGRENEMKPLEERVDKIRNI